MSRFHFSRFQSFQKNLWPGAPLTHTNGTFFFFFFQIRFDNNSSFGSEKRQWLRSKVLKQLHIKDDWLPNANVKIFTNEHNETAVSFEYSWEVIKLNQHHIGICAKYTQNTCILFYYWLELCSKFIKVDELPSAFVWLHKCMMCDVWVMSVCARVCFFIRLFDLFCKLYGCLYDKLVFFYWINLNIRHQGIQYPTLL